MQIHVQIFRDTDESLVARVDEYPELLASGFTFDELREAVDEQVSHFAGEPLKIDPATFVNLHVEPVLIPA